MSVQVCPWNDRECGDRESSWCHHCPKRTAMPNIPYTTPLTEQRVREIVREEILAYCLYNADQQPTNWWSE